MIFHQENKNISLGKINDYYPVRDYMIVAEYHIYIDWTTEYSYLK